MGNGKVKANKVLKSLEQRSEEASRMLDKLRDLGLSEEMEGVSDLVSLIEEWRRVGFSDTKQFKLTGLKRIAKVCFCMRPANDCSLALLYNETV